MLHRNLKDNLYVGTQFALFFIFFFELDLGLTLPNMLKIPGLLLFLVGGIVALVSIIQLNRNLTAFPTPKEQAHLYTNGLYHYARHPIYTGIIMLFIGLSFWWFSIYKLMITIALIVLFYFKSEYEESQLISKYRDYSEYKNNTGRFFPWF